MASLYPDSLLLVPVLILSGSCCHVLPERPAIIGVIDKVIKSVPFSIQVFSNYVEKAGPICLRQTVKRFYFNAVLSHSPLVVDFLHVLENL